MSEHGKRIHLGCAPRYLLMLRHQGMSWDDILEGGRPDGETDEEIEAQVQADHEAGKTYLFGDCNNRDEKGKCLGHPY